MTFPDRTDPCWRSAEWRTEQLKTLMAVYSLSISNVSDLTDTKYSTAACWRTTADRPIGISHLKALIFEIDRGLGMV